MDLEQIKELIARVEEGKLSKFVLKQGDFELHLEKGGVSIQPFKASPSVFEEPFQSEVPMHGERGGSVRHSEVPVKAGTFVSSPMVGTFYATPATDQPPFVKIGDLVQENTVVCIIEAMKVMNEVKAGVAGTVIEIIAENAEPVEFGSHLFRIEPV